MSVPNSNLVLRELQQAVCDYLDSDAWFDLIPVIREEMGDLSNLIDISLGKLGCCVVVETPVANCESPNVPSMFFNDIPIVVTVWENVLLNRTASGSQKYALDTAQIIAALLQHWNWTEGVGIFVKIPTILKAGDDPLGYHVFFSTEGGFHYDHVQTLSSETSADLLTEAGAVINTGS